ncbi:MAG: TonB-dependent receptor, partial [Steroidobacteraceae bacterium]
MTTKKLLPGMLIAGLMCLNVLPRAARGQVAQNDEVASAGALQEVIVTARKRHESLEKTPIAITAFTAASLEAHHIVSVDQIAQFTPNMNFVNTASFSGSTSAASVFIRGVGQTDFNQNTQPGVGIYVDGVYLARSVGSAFDLLDVDRIEVLSGPQGTLFGQNTIGGAIQVITKQPSSTPEAYVDVTTGAADRLDVKTGVSGPLGEHVQASLAVLSMQQNGYIERINTPNKDMLGNVDSLAARGRIVWEPTDAVTVDTIVDASRDDTNGTPTVVVAINGASAPFAGYYNADLLSSVNPANNCAIRT